MIAVCKVGTESIPVIQHLAQITWKQAYASIISPEQMAYMLELFYSNTALEMQMQGGHQFIVAFENDEAVGFASYSEKYAEGSSVYRLHKIYMHPAQQGKGIGKLLTGFIINDLKNYAATDLELNVNRHNKALDFYKKLGFTITREEDIDIGSGYFMNDYVMNLALNDQ
ncbi:MAG: GNAT family N-acetyltransferase [Ferruginibacter sp.]